MYTQQQVLDATKAYSDENELLADVFVTKYALTDSVGNYLELTPDDMHKRLAKEFYRIVTKLLQTREERVDAENACAKEALISAAEFAARQTFARKRRTPVKIVWSLAELSQQCVSSDFAPSNAVAQLRKNKINSWAHTFTIDSGKIEISIVMTPSSITFITTKVA